MKNLIFAILYVIVFADVTLAQKNKTSQLKSIQFNESRMTGELILPSTAAGEKLPAILTLGGSEGGIPFNKSMMDSLASQGYVVLRLAYFKTDSLPDELNKIPLEYFENALAFLHQHEAVDKNKIGLLGVSKGAEAALLLASKRPEIKTVVAHVPSNVVWYGLSQNMMEAQSSWTYLDEPIPFMPYGKPATGWQTSRIADYYEAGFEQHPDKESAAIIEVEKINAPILLTSGGQDNIWPSEKMAERIMQRLEDNQFPYEKKYLHFPNAGHLLFAQINDVDKFESDLAFFGGQLEASINAQKQSIEATFNFFRKHLKNTSEN